MKSYTMIKRFTLNLVYWFLIPCLTSLAFALEELEEIHLPPGLKPSWNMEPGIIYTDYNPDSGSTWKTTIEAVNGDEYVLREQDDCTFTHKLWAAMPALTWENCSGSSGKTKITQIKGKLWPINKNLNYEVSYRRNNNSGEKWSGTRICKAEGAFKIKTKSGVYATWKVRCADQWITKIFYYAPKIEEVVAIKVLHTESNEKDYALELISRTLPSGELLVTGNSLKKEKSVATHSTAESIEDQIKATQPSEQRIALLIGNADYQYTSRLDNPVHDATALAERLEDLGFETMLELNITSKKRFKQVIRHYKQFLETSPEITGLFYYAGHAVQVDGVNYLIPTQGDIQDIPDLNDEALSLDYITETAQLAGNSVNMFLLDACRDNPFRGFSRSMSRGLANQITPEGSLIVFSASPGKVAMDGTGHNSPFMVNLLKYIDTPGKHVLLMLQDVINGVRQQTQGAQVPWIQSSLYGDFYFKNKFSRNNE